MFWSLTIIRVPALNQAKVIFMLTHSVKLHHLLCGCAAAHHGMVCVAGCAECIHILPSWNGVCCRLCRMHSHSAQHTTHTFTKNVRII